MRPLNTTLLDTFVAVVECGSLSAAGEREDLVISAVSKRITELERQLGTKLFQRHGRGVRPTAAGELLYQHSRTIFRSLQAAQQAMHLFNAAGHAHLRLVANQSAIIEFLPGPLGSYQRRAPHVHIDLVEGRSHDIPRLVAEGEAQLGIYHASAPAAGVYSEPYDTDHTCLVVPAGHPLADRDHIRLEEAVDFEFLGYLPRYTLDRFLELAGDTLSRPLTIRAQVSSFEARCRMVREGMGIALIPDAIARLHCASFGLRAIRLTDNWAHRQFYLCAAEPPAPGTDAALLMRHLLGEAGAR